jgi:hypothetical protein
MHDMNNMNNALIRLYSHSFIPFGALAVPQQQYRSERVESNRNFGGFGSIRINIKHNDSKSTFLFLKLHGEGGQSGLWSNAIASNHTTPHIPPSALLRNGL